MKQRHFRFLIFFLAACVVGMFFVHAVAAGSLNTGIQFAAQTGLSGQDIRVTIAKIIRIALGFLGIIAVGLTMYAGFLWMTSNGNEEKLTQAKLILRNAVIGLIIILASFGIVTFILNNLLGATGGGGNGTGNGNNNGGGIGSLGNGVIKSVYPEPYQTNVAMNTSIVVTFREAMLASTICDAVTTDTPAKCSPTAKIKSENIKLFVTGAESSPVVDVNAASTDNKTFVFKPASPIGSVNGPINYTVKLTRDIKKADGSNAFNLTDFYWTFTTNNTLDLESPKIKSINDSGVFPIPDNEQDIGVSQPAVAATGKIIVNGRPNTFVAASTSVERTSPITTPPTAVKATVRGTNTCADGSVDVAISPNGIDTTVVYTGQPGGAQSENPPIINNEIKIGRCTIWLVLGSGFEAGHSWRIHLVSQKTSDTITVGSLTYAFVNSVPVPGQRQIRVGTTDAITAGNIQTAINAINPDVTATQGDTPKEVKITAKVAGSAGTGIELSTDSTAILMTNMSGGRDLSTVYTVKDNPDQPMNSVIQINFDEAVNPLMVAGPSLDIKDKLRVVNAKGAVRDAQGCNKNEDCRSYKCVGGTCQGDQLAGTFVTSNQYKTVEFISDTKCGVNGCGENIYCLPKNSNLKIEMEAATLKPCGTGCNKSPYTTCVDNVCRDTTSLKNKNYPEAATLNGIVDLADNSLDGNRNDDPQGKVDIYNENTHDSPNRGDNYLLSFFISDRLDLTPPEISSVSVNNNQSRVDLIKAIEITFSKIMMSSSLTTGTVTINNGLKEITHKLINLWSLANNPIGYWTSKQDIDEAPLDGVPDKTKVFLNHGSFGDSTEYDSQVGSGVKDIYQNCYKPSVGPSETSICNATASLPSCCRNSSGNLVPTANLTPDGNCP